eukprot:NODE_185_length_15706_cov_0.275902.p6 type:complete len:252 gc:universal NODE_185_length_15706_cov_0.275902:15375-14620(-)
MIFTALATALEFKTNEYILAAQVSISGRKTCGTTASSEVYCWITGQPEDIKTKKTGSLKNISLYGNKACGVTYNPDKTLDGHVACTTDISADTVKWVASDDVGIYKVYLDADTLCKTSYQGVVACTSFNRFVSDPKTDWVIKKGTKLTQISISGRIACGTNLGFELYCSTTFNEIQPFWRKIGNPVFKEVDVRGQEICVLTSKGAISCFKNFFDAKTTKATEGPFVSVSMDSFNVVGAGVSSYTSIASLTE